MAIAAIAPWPLGLANILYGVVSILLSSWFVWLAVRVAQSRETDQAAMKAERALFKFSIVYLFALFGILVADRVLLP
jgi:protoheme IX farnesyltransferase